MKFFLVIMAVVSAFAVACSSGEDQPTPTPTPPTGGPDPMVVQTLADRTEPGSDISVVGYVVIEPTGARLCDGLLESLPPQCGLASVSIVDYEDLGIDFEEAQGVRWTEHKVALRGSWRDGVFTPTGLLE